VAHLPTARFDDAVAWVGEHLGDLTLEGRGAVSASARFRGGQAAADAALERWNPSGYAWRRNDVWPPSRRGASALSPYLRHGLRGLRRSGIVRARRPDRPAAALHAAAGRRAMARAGAAGHALRTGRD